MICICHDRSCRAFYITGGVNTATFRGRLSVLPSHGLYYGLQLQKIPWLCINPLFRKISVLSNSISSFFSSVFLLLFRLFCFCFFFFAFIVGILRVLYDMRIKKWIEPNRCWFKILSRRLVLRIHPPIEEARHLRVEIFEGDDMQLAYRKSWKFILRKILHYYISTKKFATES